MRSRPVVRRSLATIAALAAVSASVSTATTASAQAPDVPTVPSVTSRLASPIVLTGAQLPSWSGPSASGVAEPYPSGSDSTSPIGDEVRTAHNGTLVVPPATGVDTDTISAWSWVGGAWQEVPVQVDQRFPYFLANGRSDFGFYSGTDQELTYAWNPDAHSVGEEAWKKFFGTCTARYASSAAEAAANPLVTPGPQETALDYTKAMADPVGTLDADDEIALQARDAGALAPADAAPPAGALPGGHTVAVADPLGVYGVRYIYLFAKPGGSTFNSDTSEVKHLRDPDADEFIDKATFANGSPDQLSSSNTGYGPNLPGKVCNHANGSTTPRDTNDRFPRDGVTIQTPTYRLYASGRWMVRSYNVRKPTGGYGLDLIDRWKGRAFQQSPDSTVSVVGFEDEQVNWEANGALLGWRAGAVRAIREIWGADSGTNVTKTETYYRDADVYRYRVRVHPIPPDGLYTSWDYNPDVASVYYNPQQPGGVVIDGRNDDTGNVDEVPISGQAAFADVCDPSFDTCSAVNRSEEVAGKDDNGAAVYTFELVGATSAVNFAAVPYYRDDACLDDGTGDAPIQRPWPGEAMTDSRVSGEYVRLAKLRGAPDSLTFDQLKDECLKTEGQAAWGHNPFQGAFASHGIHFFFAGDSDNATLGTPATEIDGQQWRYAVPMSAPRNASVEYGTNVVAPLKAAAAPYGQLPVVPGESEPVVPEVPWAPLMPILALAGGAVFVVRRRRQLTSI